MIELALGDVLPWLRSRLASAMKPLRREWERLRRDARKALDEVRGACDRIREEGEKCVSDRDHRKHRPGRAALRFHKMMSGVLASVSLPEDLSTEAIAELQRNLARVYNAIGREWSGLLRQMEPYMIRARMKLKGVWRKLGDIVRELDGLAARCRPLELEDEVAAHVSRVERTKSQLEEVEAELGALSVEKREAEQSLAELLKAKEVLESSEAIRRLREAEEVVEHLSMQVRTELRHAWKGLVKLRSSSEAGVLSLGPGEAEALAAYISNPARALAEDEDGSITEINIYVEGDLVATAEASSHVYNWNTADLELGPYILSATATDDEAKSTAVNILVLVDNLGGLNPDLTYGSVSDIDGNSYGTIEIGTQVWMAENLKVTHYRNGDPIPNVTDNVGVSSAWALLYHDGVLQGTYGMNNIASDTWNFTFSSPLTSGDYKAVIYANDSEGNQNSTINLALGYFDIYVPIDFNGTFLDKNGNPLDIDMLIVDEASMLDLLLTNHLLKAIPPGAHLLLVGDVDQLPSVGAGNVLRDVIDSGEVAVVQLDTIFRQAADSYIITNAHRINQGQMPLFPKDARDFFLFKIEDVDRCADMVVDLVQNRIPGRFGIPSTEIQVLSPMHRGVIGVGIGDGVPTHWFTFIVIPQPGQV